MYGELVITEEIMAERFEGERDLVTYAPYRVGDRVVRCGACRAVIKSEFISSGCPLCGRTPFPSAPVDPNRQSVITSSTRSLKTFFWLLFFSVLAAYIPFAFPKAADFIYMVAFDIAPNAILTCIGIISLIAALVLYYSETCRYLWKWSSCGSLFVFVPFSAPYLVLAIIWLAMIAIGVSIFLGLIALWVGLISSFFD